jgi:HK97 family phage portal protein
MKILDRFFNRAPIRPATTKSGILSFLNLNSVDVGVVNSDTALKHTTVYACVDIITSTLASVALNVYQKDKNSNRILASNHSLYEILKHSPNEYLTRFDYIRIVYQDILLRGNHYSQIVKNGRGEIIGLYPLIADNMQVKLKKNGAIVYEYQTADNKYALNQDEIFHLKGLPDTTGLKGLNPIEYNRKAIELSMTTEQFGINFFKNGANGSGILTHPQVLSDEAYDRLRKSFEDKYQGLANSGKPLILEEGMKYERLSLSNEDSQFLDTRRFQKTEIAALFKVPPYMLGDMSKATFNNMEQMMTNFVMTCLMPNAVNFELAARKYLFRNKDFYVKFNLNSLMRGDFKTRTDGYRTLINIGAITPNEVRELEEFNSKGPEADELYMQMNMTTLKKINEGDGNATNQN